MSSPVDAYLPEPTPGRTPQVAPAAFSVEAWSAYGGVVTLPGPVPRERLVDGDEAP